MASRQSLSGGFSIQALKDGLEAPPPGTLGPGLPRVRLMIGMAEAVAEKGYGATTIADVVRHARVSRRTFYEHFEDKEDCFLAAYDGASALILKMIAGASAPDLPWERRMMAALSAYLDGMVQEPALTRVFLVDVLSAGPKALARRREVHERFAAQQRALVEELRAERPEVQELSPAMSMALVAAMDELVLLAVQDGVEEGRIETLRDTAASLLTAVVMRRSDP